MKSRKSRGSSGHRWWVPGEFRALSKTTHCCNKLPAITKCVKGDISAAQADDVDMCLDYMPPKGTDCVVYSFGIANLWGFDDTMADAGCRVHSFDPTAKTLNAHRAHDHANVSFHYVGLRGKADDTSAQSHNNAATYYGPLGGTMMDLGEIMTKLNHGKIDILKIDCEGCEWDAFAHLANAKPHVLDALRVLIVEVHLSEELMMKDEAALRKFISFYHEFVEIRGWRRPESCPMVRLL